MKKSKMMIAKWSIIFCQWIHSFHAFCSIDKIVQYTITFYSQKWMMVCMKAGEVGVGNVMIGHCYFFSAPPPSDSAWKNWKFELLGQSGDQWMELEQWTMELIHNCYFVQIHSKIQYLQLSNSHIFWLPPTKSAKWYFVILWHFCCCIVCDCDMSV